MRVGLQREDAVPLGVREQLVEQRSGGVGDLAVDDPDDDRGAQQLGDEAGFAAVLCLGEQPVDLVGVGVTLLAVARLGDGEQLPGTADQPGVGTFVQCRTP